MGEVEGTRRLQDVSRCSVLLQGKWTALLSDPGATPPAGARGLCPGADQYIAAVAHFGRAMALAARGSAAAAAGDLAKISSNFLAGAAAELAGLQARVVVRSRPSGSRSRCTS